MKISFFLFIKERNKSYIGGIFQTLIKATSLIFLWVIVIVSDRERVYAYLNTLTEREIDHVTNDQISSAFPTISKPAIRRLKKEYLDRRAQSQDGKVIAKSSLPPSPPQAAIISPDLPPLPPSPGGFLSAELIPDSIKPLLALAPALKDCPSWLGPLILEKIRFLTDTHIPPWTRPSCLSPKQHQIIDAISSKTIRIVFIDGDKRTGKSTAAWIGICENIWNDTRTRWGFWAKTEKLAEKIHRDVKYDPITLKACQPLYLGMGSAQRTVFFNNGYIETGATESENSFSGQAYQGVWIDECHSVIKSNPKTFAMIAMILRSEPHMKMVLSANQGGLEFQALKESLEEVIAPDQIAFFQLKKEDTTHITEEADALVRVLVEASAGQDMAAQFLDNAVVREAGLYYPAPKIYEAYQEFDPPNLEQYDVVACGIDWGDNHDSAFCVLGFQGDEAFEEEIVYLQHPDNEVIERTCVRLIREYPGIIFIWENSPLGSFVRNTLRKRYPNVRFIDSGFSNYKQSYIDNTYIWLVDGDLHLKDGKLKRQLLSYVNDKKNDDGHDALCHCLYKAKPARTQMKQTISVIQRD